MSYNQSTVKQSDINLDLDEVYKEFYIEAENELQNKKDEAKSLAKPTCKKCYGRGWLEGQNYKGQYFIKFCDKSMCSASKFIVKERLPTYILTKNGVKTEIF